MDRLYTSLEPKTQSARRFPAGVHPLKRTWTRAGSTENTEKPKQKAERAVELDVEMTSSPAAMATACEPAASGKDRSLSP
jgi:hypothetical protein